MPSLRSGRPDVSSPPTGNHPRHARPPCSIAIARFSSSGSAKNSRADASRSRHNVTGTPWPTIEKKPTRRQASSIARATGSIASRVGAPRSGVTSTTGTVVSTGMRPTLRDDVGGLRGRGAEAVEQPADLGRGQRLREAEPLQQLAAELFEAADLVAMLDALGDRAEVQRVGQGDDRVH